ncbi:flagellar basal body rod protein FlgF [Thalassomonas actiniarum]|nr:flagellar basal body rod protein FlgF [Thalassomonas actiniarum]
MELLYTALSGAKQAQTSMTIRANNLANVNTTGFRADLERTAAYQVDGYGFNTRYMSQSEQAGTNFTSGQLQETGRTLDVAIQGEGYLAVQAPSGQEAYTRAGNIMVDGDGQAFINGNPVLADGGQLILPEYQQITIGKDGTVSVIPLGGGAQIEAGQITLVKPDNTAMTKGQDGLLYLKNGAQAPVSDEVELVSGFLESSNVNAVTELVSSMAVNRQFELQIKMMKTADTLAQSGNKLISGS